MVNFEWYRSFIAVYRSGTVTGGAEARHLTQPAISQHLVALESALGQSLFVRKPRKMVPTEFGKTLYSQMAPSLDRLEKVTRYVNHEGKENERASLRLGVPLDYFNKVVMPRIKEAPYDFELDVGTTQEMLERLSSEDKLHAVIATSKLTANHLDYTQIDQEEFILVASSEFDFPQTFNELDALEQRLLNQNWLTYSPELPIIRRFWHIAFGHRPNIKPHLILPSLLTILKGVETGMGISVLPRYLCEESIQNGIIKKLWKPDKPVMNELWLVNRKVDRNKPEVDYLKSLLG